MICHFCGKYSLKSSLRTFYSHFVSLGNSYCYTFRDCYR